MRSRDHIALLIMDNSEPSMRQFSEKIKTKVRYLERNKTDFPDNEDSIGRKLFELVSNQSFLGGLPLELWLFTESSIQIINFGSRVSFVQVSALCGLEGVQFVAMLGGATKKDGQKIGFVFMEWRDCRWWFGSQALGQDGGVILNYPMIKKASERDDKPLGFGGWFSTARRLGLRAQIVESDQSSVH